MSVLEHKVEKTLSVLRQVSIAESMRCMSPTSLLQLYKAIIVPQMEFASPVWVNSKSVDILNNLQTKSLALCLSVPGTTALDALKVKASVLPLDLRRESCQLG